MGVNGRISWRKLPWYAAAVLAATAPASTTQADEAPPAAPQFKSFATPYFPLNGKVICYIGNVGRKTIHVRGFGLRNPTTPLHVTRNSCPGLGSFALTSGMSCYIDGSNNSSSEEMYTACLATSDDAGALRGSLEFRDANGKTAFTARMTSGADGSQPLASPPMFSSSVQSDATCVLLNAGTATAILSDVRMVTSSGQSLTTTAICADAHFITSPAGRLPPGGICEYRASSIPISDLQCLARATHRSDVRGIFFVYGHGPFNVKSLR